MVATASEDDGASSRKSTKLVTFLGKGGSGKTTSAVFAAQVLFSNPPHLFCCLKLLCPIWLVAIRKKNRSVVMIVS